MSSINSESTPMMKQYLDAKKTARDALLLFRMGDFYEMFFEDAYKAADALALTVTTRDRNKGADATPMAGFPHHQLENYLAKLIQAGFKVAVCEQMEDPRKAKGIVKREVVRIVTPGTVTDEAILDPRQANFLAAAALFPKKKSKENKDLWQGENSEKDSCCIDSGEPVGLAWCELSTGHFCSSVVPFSELFDQLGRIGPAEILVPEGLDNFFPSYLTEKMSVTKRPDWTFTSATAEETLKAHFQVHTLEGFGFTGQSDVYAVCAAGAVLNYLRETQKQSLDHIETLTPYRLGGQMEIDEASRRSLELTQTSRDRRRDGSLLSVLDCCGTAMGSRLMNEWLVSPLTKIDQIEVRQDAVEELAARSDESEKIQDILRRVYDLERIMAKVTQERSTPRDLVFIGKTLQIMPLFRDFLRDSKSALLKTLYSSIDVLDDLCSELISALNPDAPLNWKDGGFISAGYSVQLDEYRDLQRGGKEWLLNYQATEIQRSGISNLRVGYTNVFGYYIEVSRSNSERVPDNYVRKQTLKNAERFITPELREYEEKVLKAEENAKDLEFELFYGIQKKVIAVRSKLQRNAGVLAHLDALINLAMIARSRGYTRPKIVEDAVLNIIDGRHPVLDVIEQSGTFVPNNACCDSDHGMLHLITGPNMAGKSTFIRQNALLVIMAQMGSFIPAACSTIGIVDRIFARVGASDELTRGQSTFMVEMIETARILNGATSKSLVILDEIGRGTSTYDGISLAWAIAEYLHEKIGCRTFFATHYHELTELANTFEGISNLNVAVRESNDEIAFLHKILPGAADKSYGIHVARLAGVPKEVIRRARDILLELEQSHLEMADMAVRNALQNASWSEALKKESEGKNNSKHRLKNRESKMIQFSLFGPEDHPVIDEIRSLDISRLSPLDALNLLEKWQKNL